MSSCGLLSDEDDDDNVKFLHQTHTRYKFRRTSFINQPDVFYPVTNPDKINSNTIVIYISCRFPKAVSDAAHVTVIDPDPPDSYNLYDRSA